MKVIDIDCQLIERAKALFLFDKEKGVLLWKEPTSNRVRKGDMAGRINNAGHLGVGIDGKRYQVHRLVWCMHNGPIPDGFEIDHVDEDKTNNRLGNLRLASRSQNMSNVSSHAHNTSGVKGISFNRAAGKWEAYVHFNYKKYNLGLFENKENAEKEVRIKRDELHKEFAK